MTLAEALPIDFHIKTGKIHHEKTRFVLLDRWTHFLEEVLRDLEFVYSLEEDLYCNICNMLLIQPWQFDGNRYCEICRLSQNIRKGFSDKFALKQILSLKCFCKNKSKGCDWLGKVYELEDHFMFCSYVRRKKCCYKTLGCEFQGTESDILRHYKTSAYQHIGTVCVSLTEESTDITELLKQLIKSINYIYLDRQSLENFKDHAKTVTNNLSELYNYCNKNSIKELSVENKQYIHSFINIVKYITKVSTKYNQLRKHFSQKSLDQRKDYYRKSREKILEKTKNLSGLHTENTKQHDQLESKFTKFSEISFDGYFIARINNILEKIETARYFNDTSEYISPYIYTHKYGYKFYFKINFNTGIEHSYSSKRYIGIFVVFVPGNYDDILTFPMPYSIEIRIKNFSRHQETSFTIIPDSDLESFQRPWSEDGNIPVGVMKFISHEELLQKGYVSEGAIFIELNATKISDNNFDKFQI